MLKGIYSAAAGITSQLLLSDIGANNLANINTPGFKGSGAQFQAFGEALVSKITGSGSSEVGAITQGSKLLSSFTNFGQGDLVQTGNPLDAAIQGDGFFTVKSPDGNTYYTRAGKFGQDSEGYLTMSDGSRIQGEGGDIQIPKGAKKIVITGTGDVVADNAVLDRLKVAQFSDNQKLERIGGLLYKANEEPLPTVTDVTVQQGFIEQANTNVITEMVNPIAGLRAYEIMQKSIQMQNDTLGKAVNDVGRVGG